MRLVTFQSIYDGVLRRFGLDASSDDISTDTGMAIAEKASQRIGMIIDIWDWAELSRTEERAFRPIWDPATNYHTIGDEGNPDEFYYPANETYYRVNSIIGGDPPPGTLPTNGAYFEVLQNPEPFIARDQVGRAPMGTVLGIYPTNPSLNGNCDNLLSFQPSERGVKVLGSNNNNPWWIAPNPPQPVSPTTVFVWYLIVPPEYTWKPYISFKSYVPGNRVFFAPPAGDGNCYRAIAPTQNNDPSNIDFWVLEPVPASLDEFLKEGVYADLLQDGINGEPATMAALQAATAANERADTAKENQIDRLLAQGQKHFYGGAAQWRWTGVWTSQPWGGDKVITIGGQIPPSGIFPTPAGIGSPWEYRREIISILGPSLSLEALSTTNRSPGSMVTIVIGASGDRQRLDWNLLPGNANPLDAGQVKPLDYNLSTNQVHWEKVE